MNLLVSLATALLVNILTYQYDNTRAGVNSQEVILTPANVNASQFGKLFSQPVDGVLYGQPLYLAGVASPGQGTHNVIYAAIWQMALPSAQPAFSFKPLRLVYSPNAEAAVLNQDYSVNTPDNPASAGSYVAAYLTGLGPVQPAVATGVPAPLNVLSSTTNAVTATIGGIAAVVFAGLAPGYAGLYQVNIQVPQLPSGRYLLQVSIGGIGSNTAYINIQ
jgi:hypothetical protein